jgi:hypothetical protein
MRKVRPLSVALGPLSVAFTLACALASNAFAGEGAEVEARAAKDQIAFFANDEARALRTDELDDLRGGLPAPAAPQQLGVLLWDEPRPGRTPHGTSKAPAPEATGGATIQVTSQVNVLR